MFLMSPQHPKTRSHSKTSIGDFLFIKDLYLIFFHGCCLDNQRHLHLHLQCQWGVTPLLTLQQQNPENWFQFPASQAKIPMAIFLETFLNFTGTFFLNTANNAVGGMRGPSALDNGLVSIKWAIMWPIYCSATPTVHSARWDGTWSH